jgi:AcrR family transcriptional regulator
MVAAIQEVVDHGYEGATLTRIAARADVAKGLVWRYFTGKDGVHGEGDDGEHAATHRRRA